jgi:hypothetical protein
MESVDWVHRYYYFGAMYDMVCLGSLVRSGLIIQQGVNDLNCLFDLDQEHRRSGALSELGVQYAGSNGTIPTRDRWGNYSGAGARASLPGPGLLALLAYFTLL